MTGSPFGTFTLHLCILFAPQQVQKGAMYLQTACPNGSGKAFCGCVGRCYCTPCGLFWRRGGGPPTCGRVYSRRRSSWLGSNKDKTKMALGRWSLSDVLRIWIAVRWARPRPAIAIAVLELACGRDGAMNHRRHCRTQQSRARDEEDPMGYGRTLSKSASAQTGAVQRGPVQSMLVKSRWDPMTRKS